MSLFTDASRVTAINATLPLAIVVAKVRNPPTAEIQTEALPVGRGR